MKKNWLVFARREKCHHREALENLHFIDWTMEYNNFSVGDIVYIYPTNEDGIKFKTEVVAKNCERKDGDYWVDKKNIDSYPTYRLELRKEYFGDKLSEEDLRRYGFKGGQSKRRPLYNKPEMFAYIETVFNDSTHVKVCGDKVEEQIRSGQSFGYGGEGDSHKELKEYIFNNPNVIGIEEYTEKETEHILLSADRIDVWFKLADGSCVAVEVKSHKSTEADILRGIFQCVKYKAIMDAEDKVHRSEASNSSILVLGGTLSEHNKYYSDMLGVTVIDNVKIVK